MGRLAWPTWSRSARPTAPASITVTFESGTNIDLAQVEVQNRLSRATPRLPSAVAQQGVRVEKSRSNILMFAMLSSSNPAVRPRRAG
jgi:multidrug efflux pump